MMCGKIKKEFFLLLCLSLMVLSACTPEIKNAGMEAENDQEGSYQEEIGNTDEAEAVGDKTVSDIQIKPVPPDILQPEATEREYAAKALLSSAFSFDSGGSAPTTTEENGLVSLRYLKDEEDPSDFFVVDFYEGYDFPMTLYHFSHPNDENKHIENEKDFVFDEGMVEEAKRFLAEVYGVDCTASDIYAYGYENKISVQFNVSEDQIFQVRFYYKEKQPVGLLYFTEEAYAEEAMEANDAVMLYSFKKK